MAWRTGSGRDHPYTLAAKMVLASVLASQSRLTQAAAGRGSRAREASARAAASRYRCEPANLLLTQQQQA